MGAKKRFRIGITCYPFIGGSGIVATELGIELARIGHEVHFITLSQPVRLRHLESNIFFHRVDVEDYPVFHSPPYALNLAVKMAEVARSRDLDLLHVHYAIPHAVSAYLAREMLEGDGIRIVTSLHGTDITLVGSRPSLYDITRFSIERSDAVTTVSEFLRCRTLETFGLDIPITVIHNFVDPGRFKPLADAKLRSHFADAHEKIMLHASNFRPVKRLDSVIKVFSRVAGALPARMLLLGDGPETQKAERMAEELGVADRILFLGGNESVEEIIPAADLFIMPSSQEAFGLAALEAMSCAVPVIGTLQGGMREFIEVGETGFLFEPDDVEGMAGAAIRLLRDDALRLSMGEKARKVVIERYTVRDLVEKYVEVYRALL